MQRRMVHAAVSRREIAGDAASLPIALEQARAYATTLAMPLTADRARMILGSLIGEPVWGVRSGEDRVLQAEFGQPYLRTEGAPGALADASTGRLMSPAGRWTLFVENGAWSVEAGGLTCRRAETGAMEARALNALSGQMLTHVAVDGDDVGLAMTFDLSGTLSVRSIEGSDDGCQWMLFCRGEGVLAFDAGSGFSLEF